MKLLFSSDLHGLDSAYYAFAAALKDGDYDLRVLGGDLMTYPSRSEIEQTGIELQKTGEIYQIQDGRPPQAVIDHALLDKQKYYRRMIKKSGKPVIFLL